MEEYSAPLPTAWKQNRPARTLQRFNVPRVYISLTSVITTTQDADVSAKKEEGRSVLDFCGFYPAPFDRGLRVQVVSGT